MIDYSGQSVENVTMPAVAAMRAAVSRSKLKIPSAARDMCLKIHERYMTLADSRSKVDMRRLTEEFQATAKRAVREVADGVSHPDTIAGLNLETFRREWQVRASNLDEAIKLACAQAHPYLDEISKAVVEGLTRFEAEMEKEERDRCAAWSVEFEPSPILKSITHIRKYAIQSLTEGYGVGASPIGQLSMWFQEFADA
jgi:hypothetical protein